MIEDVNASIYLTIITLFFLILTSFMYIRREKMDTTDNKIYTILLIVTYLSIISELALLFVYKNNYLLNICMKLFLLCALAWISILFIYLITIIFDKKYNKDKIMKYSVIIYLLISFIVALLPIEYMFNNGTLQYAYGIGVTVSFSIGGVLLVLLMLLLFCNIKKINKNKIIPICVFIILISISAIIQVNYPSFLLINFVFGIVITIMYFTTESQDVKLIYEYENIKKESLKFNKAKNEYLVNMSHEIRTPLTTILGYCQTLLYKENLTEEELKKDMLNVNKANNTLLNLINSLSDISRLENNKETVKNSDYNLKSIILEIYNFIYPKINKDNLKLNIKVNPEIPVKYYGDSSKISTSLIYVILNAIEYTNYGEVTLFVDAYKKENTFYELEFIVSNTGHAMKEEIFNISFEDYLELDDKANNSNLGLIIAKKMIDICNGNIEFINKPGHGTKYIIKVNQKNYTEEEKIGDIFDDYEYMNLSINFIDCSDKKALVVEDKQENIDIITGYLKNYNFNIVSVKSGKEAIKLIQKERYDIVFLDYIIPEENGLETLRNLKSLMEELPFIILLVKNIEYDKINGLLKEGFDGYITKPIKHKEFNNIINNKFGKTNNYQEYNK